MENPERVREGQSGERDRRRRLRMGNLRSVAKALAHVAPEREIVVSGDPAVIRAAERIVLPDRARCPTACAVSTTAGLPASCATCSATARSSASASACRCSRRERGGATAGLGVLPGRVVGFRTRDAHGAGERLKVPHMAGARAPTRAHPLWQGIADGTRSTSPTATIPFRTTRRSRGHHGVSGAVYLRDSAGYYFACIPPGKSTAPDCSSSPFRELGRARLTAQSVPGDCAPRRPYDPRSHHHAMQIIPAIDIKDATAFA